MTQHKPELLEQVGSVERVEDAPRDDCGDRRAAHRPVVERRVAAPGLRVCGTESPDVFGVEDGHVAVRADAERAAIRERENLRGVDRAEFDEAFEADDAPVHEAFKGEANGGFESGDAERGLVVFERFFVRVVRRVVCGDGVNRPVAQGFDDRFNVLRAAQRRAHLRVRVVVAHGVVCERPVVRRRFARHAQAALLRAPHGFERAARGDVREVHACAG